MVAAASLQGGSGEGMLSPDQEKAILALLNQPTVKKAAEQAGVGERSIYRWMDQPVFMDTYRRARRRAFNQAIAMTQRYTAAAVQALARVMTDPEEPAGARVAAATTILKFSRESIELDDLAARLEVIERKLDPDGAAAPVIDTEYSPCAV